MKKCNKVVFLNVIQRDGDAAQMWSADWILPPVEKFQHLLRETAKRGKGVILFYFYFYSILFIYFSHALMLTACLFYWGGRWTRLPRGFLVPSFRGRSFFCCCCCRIQWCSSPQRLQAALCSTRLVCHLNEAFRPEEGGEEEEVSMKTALRALALAPNWPYFREVFLNPPPCYSSSSCSVQSEVTGASCRGRRGMKLTWCV